MPFPRSTAHVAASPQWTAICARQGGSYLKRLGVFVERIAELLMVESDTSVSATRDVLKRAKGREKQVEVTMLKARHQRQ